MSPSFNFPGHQPTTPAIVDFELQTVVKGRLSTDLYVVFIIDGETVSLSSRPWDGRPIANPPHKRRYKKDNLTLVHFCDVLCDVRVREPFLVLAFNFQDNLTFLLKGLRPGGG
jgi:hypothetical protein